MKKQLQQNGIELATMLHIHRQQKASEATNASERLRKQNEENQERRRTHDFKNTLKGHQIRFTFTLSSMLISAMHYKSRFQEATDLSIAEQLEFMYFLPR